MLDGCRRCVQCKEQWREASPCWFHTASHARTDDLTSAIYRIKPGFVQPIHFTTLYSPSYQSVNILRLITRSGSVSKESNRSSVPGLSITVLGQGPFFRQRRKRLSNSSWLLPLAPISAARMIEASLRYLLSPLKSCWLRLPRDLEPKTLLL